LPNALKHMLFIAVPLLAVLAVLPGVYQNHLLLFNFVIFLILAQGVNIIYGFTGYLPFGYVGFFGAGAYGFAVLVMHFQTPAVLAVLFAGVIGVALGLLLTPLLRLSGAYFAIANLAASLAVLHLIANPALEPITRGPYGVSLTGAFNPTYAYAAALVVLALTLGVVVFLKNSRFGLALQAVREDAVSASMAGVDVVRMRTIAWLTSALVAGLAGGVYAWYVSVFFPGDVFSGDFSIFAIVFALFGGVASITGPIVGVIILYGIYNLIGFTTPQYFQLIYGLLIMGLVLFLPAGLVSLATRRGWNVP
jgi:branched-chain amino acid transport system permease protein